MNESSAGWRTVRFGDVVRNVDEAVRDALTCDLERFVGLEHIDPESLRIKRWGLIADGTSFTRKLTAGQVLFGKRRAYQRKVAVADFEGLCSSDILVFEPADDRLLPELLPFIVQTEGFFQHALGTSAGSLSPRTRWRDLAAYEFPLPPLDEQRRIAEILWAAEEVFSRTQALVAATKLTKQVAIGDLFQRLTSTSVPLGNWADYVTSGSRWWAQYYSSQGAIFLRVTNLTRESADLDLSDIQFVSPEPSAETARTRVAAGDLLVSVTADLGRVAVVPADFPEAYVNQHVALVRLRPGSADPHYVACYLLSAEGQKQFRVLNDAGAKAGMNLVSVQRLQIPNMTMTEQLNVVGLVRAFDKSLVSQQKHLSQQMSLRRNLLRYSLNDSQWSGNS